jgi:glycosyltransferase involved in cell wall biosynthesis
MSPPRISIIVAVFNGVKTLQQCLDSVAAQTHAERELIVIDGGSTDGTVALLEKNRAQFSYWITEPDRGIYNAWNKGLAQAHGDWICFLGADDYFWDTRVLERAAAVLEKLPPEIRVAYGRVMVLSTEGQALFPLGEPWENIREKFKAVMCIPHQGVMHRRNLFAERGNFDESYRIAGDYELLLRELKTADAACLPDLIVAGMRHGGISSAPKNSVASLREIRRAQRRHGERLPRLTWVLAMFRVHVRLLIWNCLGEHRAKQALDFVRRLKGAPPYWTRL